MVAQRMWPRPPTCRGRKSPCTQTGSVPSVVSRNAWPFSWCEVYITTRWPCGGRGMRRGEQAAAAAYNTLEGEPGVDDQPLGAAETQVRVQEGDAERARGLAHDGAKL